MANDMKVNGIVVATAGVILLSTAVGCGSLRLAEIQSNIDSCDVESGRCQWDSRYRYLQRVSRGADPNSEDFGVALEYFEATTGIHSGILRGWAGYIVSRSKLRIALEQWEEWCSGVPSCPGDLDLYVRDDSAPNFEDIFGDESASQSKGSE